MTSSNACRALARCLSLVVATFVAAGALTATAAAKPPTLVTLTGQIAPAIAGSPTAEATPSEREIDLAIVLPLRNEADLAATLAALDAPGSVHYHRYLSPQDFTERYAPTQADYDAVTVYAENQGLTVTGTSTNRLVLDVAGSASAVERAFHVALWDHVDASGNFFTAPDGDPKVPAAVAAKIEAVVGLDDPTPPAEGSVTQANWIDTYNQIAADGTQTNVGAECEFPADLTPPAVAAAANAIRAELDAQGQSCSPVSVDWRASAAAASVQAPAAPTKLAATALSIFQINLTWTASSGTTSYLVLRGTKHLGPYTQIGTTTSAAFGDTNALVPNTTYYYVVQAKNSAGLSAYSNEATTETPVAPAPSFVQATPISPTQVNVEWSVVPGATGYVILRGTKHLGPYAQFGTATTTIVADTNKLTPATAYYYVVEAQYTTGVSGFSMEATATTPGLLPPANVAATAGAAGQINLTWSASVGANSYLILRGTKHLGPYTQVGTSTFASYSDQSKLAAKTEYYYVVQASYTAGLSPVSAEASATTVAPPPPPAAPTGLTVIAATTACIELAWNSTPQATGYILLRSTKSGGPYTTVTSFTAPASPTAPGFTDSNLAWGTTYYYVVEATNAGGTSVNSSQTTAVTTTYPPSLVEATPTYTAITVTWLASTGATSYIVLRAKIGGTYAQIGTTTKTTYTDSGLPNKTTYSYVIRAVDAGGTSGNSSAGSTTTL